jgi:DNA (cytosine-5)-methyltransferase 1
MKHLDLFSGIGGFALAVDTVWPNSEHIFVENDDFCTQVLKKHWPKATFHGDIRQFITDTEKSRCETCDSNRIRIEQGKGERPYTRFLEPTFILTGGFPCQPFSQAGRRKGTEDNRYLWPEMFRVIQLTKPQWVIAENVRGLVTWNDGMVLEQVCADLEREGYTVQPFIIPAVAVNAPHRRDRVWIVGHAQHDGQHGTENREGDNQGSNNNKKGTDELRQPQGTDSVWEDVAYTEGERGQRWEHSSGTKTRNREGIFGREDWNRNWLEVATRFCQLDDGLPKRMVRLPDRTISQSKWRQEALKAYGNAIVPQVAVEIMRAIKSSTP